VVKKIKLWEDLVKGKIKERGKGDERRGCGRNDTKKPTKNGGEKEKRRNRQRKK
jgi:hypothetical protein